MSEKKPEPTPQPKPVPQPDDGPELDFTQPLGGENPRGEVAGCPTGLARPAKPRPKSPPVTGADPSVPLSPGEGVTEEQMKRSGRKDGPKK